ncbi:ras-domain-containing protein [Cantharellus anzutake]|uniref:ras-domain-containing protein n=1 Tax=Cantharellus anzutake TaxID=1750568 RepID=UPI001907C9FD|nr:ras-domain-containing protein [Cantharellus anzutake]KAF8329843.1 ras-domain-containing protein [Cantharellus anzutake]
MSSVTWDYVLKYIIVGDAGVGKSSLLVRLTDRRFLANPAQLGVEFGSKLIRIEDENKTIKLQCWDTAGTEAFRSITRSYYRGAAGALLVFDVTSRQSFTNCRVWLADIRAHADPNLTCLLLANKIDLCDEDPAQANDASRNASRLKREVTTEEAGQYAKEEGLLFLEASAKTGHNVDEAFDQAARDILKKIQAGVFDDRKPFSQSRGPKPARTNDPNQLVLEREQSKQGTCCS